MALCGLQSEERIQDVRLRTDCRFVREQASGQLWWFVFSMLSRVFAMTSYQTSGVSSEASKGSHRLFADRSAFRNLP